jgi:hypothetical protein
MFYALVNQCYCEPTVDHETTARTEPVFSFSRVAKMAKGLDMVSGLVLIIIGALIVSGVMQGSPAGAYAMLAVGGLQFGRHLFSYFICTAVDDIASAIASVKKPSANDPVSEY